MDTALSGAGQTPLVVVLMSTYNGDRFVAEQLHSILEQLPASGRVLVRDDGSSDQTVAVIQTLGDPRLQLVQGSNLGFSRSFLTLLDSAPTDADMVMFSDQDDVWLPGKICRAWQHLSPFGDQPALYGSAQMLVDANLRELGATKPWPRGPSLTNALAENMITGCTAGINRAALNVLRSAGVPEGVRFHDWWLYLVISAFGRVVWDNQPTLLYRQHGNNQIGHGTGWLGRERQIVRFILRHDWVGILLSQVGAFMAHYGTQLSPAQRQLISDLFDVRGGRVAPSWRLIFGPQYLRQSASSELSFRVLLLLHKCGIWPPPARRL